MGSPPPPVSPEASSGRLLPVFVYGTLLRGMKNHRAYLAGRYHRVQPAIAAGHLRFEPRGGYPFLLPGAAAVRGELFDLLPAAYASTLAALDELEEYDPDNEPGSVYLRRPVSVTLADGSRRRAWTYLWNGDPQAGRPVAGGDFRDLGRKR